MNDFLYRRRKLLKLTQLDMYHLTGVSDRSIRNFETRSTIPDLQTIKRLSIGYRVDPFYLFNICNDTINPSFSFIYDYLDNTSLNESKVNIDDLCSKLLNLLDCNNCISYETIYFEQYLNLLYGLKNIYLKQYDSAYFYFLKSLNVTINNFIIKDLDFYLNYLDVFSKLEIRLLYYISICLYYTGKKNLCYHIISSVVKSVNDEWNFYCEILSLHSINLYRQNKLIKGLEYANLTIQISLKRKYYKNLPIYYYNLSMFKRKLGHKSYLEDIKSCIDFCNLTGQVDLKKQINSKLSSLNINF